MYLERFDTIVFHIWCLGEFPPCRSGWSVFGILKVDSGSSCLFSLSLPSLLISIPGLCPLMFLQESFSFIEPRVYIHLSPAMGLHVKRWIIDPLFVKTGVLIWTIQPSINHWEWLPSTSTWPICAGCCRTRYLCFCVPGPCSVSPSALWSSGLRALHISEASSSHAAFRSRPRLLLRWQLDAVDAVQNILFILQACTSLVYTFKWAAAGATSLCWAVFCPCGKDSLLSLALRSQHSSGARAALILASNRLHGERCSLCFTLFIL